MRSLQVCDCSWDLLCCPIPFSEESVKIMHLTYAKVVVGGSKNSPRKEQIIIALQESCDPVVMVRETHTDFTGTKELLYLFLNLRN